VEYKKLTKEGFKMNFIKAIEKMMEKNKVKNVKWKNKEFIYCKEGKFYFADDNIFNITNIDFSVDEWELYSDNESYQMLWLWDEYKKSVDCLHKLMQSMRNIETLINTIKSNEISSHSCTCNFYVNGHAEE
jgi:hypothetical protein